MYSTNLPGTNSLPDPINYRPIVFWIPSPSFFKDHCDIFFPLPTGSRSLLLVLLYSENQEAQNWAHVKVQPLCGSSANALIQTILTTVVTLPFFHICLSMTNNLQRDLAQEQLEAFLQVYKMGYGQAVSLDQEICAAIFLLKDSAKNLSPIFAITFLS